MPTTTDVDALVEAYRTLDVEFRASERAIRHRYRELAHRYHPDKLPPGSPQQETAAERMRRINAAYELIKAAPLQTHVFDVEPADTRIRHSTLEEFERPLSVTAETLARFALGIAIGCFLVATLYARGVPGLAFYAIAIPLLLGFAFTSTSHRTADLLRWLSWWW